jgi:hypothetical protein
VTQLMPPYAIDLWDAVEEHCSSHKLNDAALFPVRETKDNKCGRGASFLSIGFAAVVHESTEAVVGAAVDGILDADGVTVSCYQTRW